MVEEEKTMFKLSNKTYDAVKQVVQVILPAAGALYFGLASLWTDVFPQPEKVVGSIAIFATFLGVVLGITSRQYEKSGAAYDGQIVVTEDDIGDQTLTLEVLGDPAKLVDKKSVSFRVGDSSWFED